MSQPPLTLLQRLALAGVLALRRRVVGHAARDLGTEEDAEECAGVLHGVLSGMDDGRALAFGLAAARLKHSVPGDFNLVGVDDVAALVDSGRLDVKR